LPALDRYDGVNFRVLRKLIREGRLPQDLDIIIISAKYGLIKSSDAIGNYNQEMTLARASELRGSIAECLDQIIASGNYEETFVNLGKTYRAALGNSKLLSKTKVTYASGGIGCKMAQMKAWLVQ
jgi:cytoplasmic iron level regulating protein YaaA (DUF328/UPF0246 family)